MPEVRTIACRLTPPLPAAIATIALRGPRAVELVLEACQLKTTRLRPGRIHYGTIGLGDGAGEAEQLVVCRTSEEVVELHCHGGQAVCREILNFFQNQGCEIVGADQWPSRQSCPIAAAAESDLIHATTDKVAVVLVDQMNGALRRAFQKIIELIAQQRVSRALQELEGLWQWCGLGTHLIQPWKVVLAGPPNVGKSSLLNAIAGQTKSIVHHEPGTTRDWIEAEVALAGWPVSLTDTAGVRASRDAVEGEGVRRARERILEADLVVLVVEAQAGWTDTHTELVELELPVMLLACNKADLLPERQRLSLPGGIPSKLPEVPSSTVGHPGIEQLLAAITTCLIPAEPEAGQAVPFRAAYTESVQLAKQLLAAGDLVAARNELERLLTSWM